MGQMKKKNYKKKFKKKNYLQKIYFFTKIIK